MSVVTVRRAVLGDAPDVATLMRASRVAVIPLIPPPVHTPEEELAWVTGHLIPDEEVWLAVDEADEILAVMALTPTWIGHLYVKPGRGGQGIGSQLVRHAKQRQPEGLQLWVFEANLPARRFYEHHGFVEVERTDGSGNEERAPDIRLEWRPAG